MKRTIPTFRHKCREVVDEIEVPGGSGGEWEGAFNASIIAPALTAFVEASRPTFYGNMFILEDDATRAMVMPVRL